MESGWKEETKLFSDEDFVVILETRTKDQETQRYPGDYNGIEVLRRAAFYDVDSTLYFVIDNVPNEMVNRLDKLSWEYIAKAAHVTVLSEGQAEYHRGVADGYNNARTAFHNMIGVDRIVSAIKSIGADKDW